MKRRALFLTIVLLLVTITVYAQHPPRAPRAPQGPLAPCHEMGMNKDFVRPGMLLRLADEVGLDENQKTQIDKLAQDNGLKRIEMKADLEKAQLKLRHMKINDATNTEVLGIMDDIGRMKTEMRKNAYTFRQSIKSILTDEQLDKIKELRMEHRRGNFPGCPGYGPGKGKGRGPDYDRGPRGGSGRW